MKDLILLGAGGHAKSIIDIIASNKQYNIVGLLDSGANKSEKSVLDVPILGGDELLSKVFENDVRYAFIAVGGTGDNSLRTHLFEKVCKMGFNIINVIHSSAIISKSANYGVGNVFMGKSIVNASTVIGDNCIINTGSIIEHDVLIKSHVHIAPGAIVAGGVEVGEYTHIGLGASVIQGVKIGKNVIIGAGAVVINDIEDNSVVVGVPAKVIKKR